MKAWKVIVRIMIEFHFTFLKSQSLLYDDDTALIAGTSENFQRRICAYVMGVYYEI